MSSPRRHRPNARHSPPCEPPAREEENRLAKGRSLLDAFFAQVSAVDFFARYWQHEPLLTKERKLERLIGIEDIDELISTISSLDAGWLMLTKDGVPKPNSTVRGRNQVVDLAAVYAAYADGYTLILTMLQQRWPAIRALCRDLEREFLARGVIFSRSVQANLYLTPTRARGFDPHYDDHDILVLQVEGAKHWRVYGQHRPRPIQAQVQRSEHLPPVVLDETMRPGQMLYVPRGFYHEASTGDGHSLHLTLSIAPFTWIDLVSKMLPLLDPFRETLPLLPDNRGDEALQKQFRKLVRLLGHGDAASVARRIADESLGAFGLLPDNEFGQRAQSQALTLDTRVRRRHGAIVRLRSDGQTSSLLFPGSGFRGPHELVPLFSFVVNHESFRIADLPDVVTAESKLEVVRQLICEGLLRVESEEDGE